MRRAWVIAVSVFVASLGTCGTASADASTSTVTLTSPQDGAVITGGQPTFQGTASIAPTANPRVTVRVCRGFIASCLGGDAENPTAPVDPSTGDYSTPASPPLADGEYTAQAEQDDMVLGPSFSGAVHFTVHNAPPAVSLDSPGSAPLLTATPTLSGVAETLPGDSSTVTVAIYPGATAAGTPVRSQPAAVASNGGFSTTVSPGLPDGQYTAIASQSDSGGETGRSSQQTFEIKANPPAVTLEEPVNGALVTTGGLLFTGHAGTALGDSSSVTLELLQGNRRLGAQTVRVQNGRWSAGWASRLAPGAYSARATQTDDAGHTAVTPPVAFTVVRAARAIGSAGTIDRSRTVTIRVTCLALAGSCTGDVLILTARRFQPVADGPAGHLRVMFAYVTIPAGRTVTVRRVVPRLVFGALRRAGSVKLRVIVTLAGAGVPPRVGGYRIIAV